MPRLHLPGHAHCCFTDDGAVLLDLRADRYSVIPRTEARTLAWLFGDRTADTASTQIHASGAAQSVAATLLQRGLVTYDRERGRPFEPLTVDLTCRVLLDGAIFQPRMRTRDVFRFLRSSVVVRNALRAHSFQYAIERLRQRKASSNQADAAFDLERATTLVQIARRIRPFIFTAHKQCLYDSLVLAEFLALYALYPCVIVGVATQPFRAHCWVQHSGMAFNSDGEDVTQYTPILSI
jgi:hypothetical protein